VSAQAFQTGARSAEEPGALEAIAAQ